MSSKLVKLIVIAVVIAGGLRIQVTRHRLAKQAGPSRDHAGPPPEAAAQVSRPEPKAITRAPLYQEARRLGVRGRSKMPKAELKVALSEGGRA